jgi:acetyltransferase-like isoleucine patch superfamily enzyme
MIKTLASLFIKLFYPLAKDANPYHILATVFLIQKIAGINRRIPWPVHFTSRVLFHKNIKLGARSFPGWSQGCYIQAKNGISIGNNLRMGPNVGLISANHNTDDYDLWVATKPIVIGNNVWLGMNVVVTPGVQIGDNVIVGANSVVTKDIPSNSIACGIPCKVIKTKPPYTGKVYE